MRALLEKKLPDAFKHIRSLRDVFDVHLQANPDESTAEESPWICPVSLVAVGVRPFVAIVPCGHVVSLRALTELSGAPTCPQCSEPMRSSSRLSLPKAEYDLAQTALLNTIEAEKAQKAALKAAKRSAVALDDANSDRPDTDVKKSRKSAVTSTAQFWRRLALLLRRRRRRRALSIRRRKRFRPNRPHSNHCSLRRRVQENEKHCSIDQCSLFNVDAMRARLGSEKRGLSSSLSDCPSV